MYLTGCATHRECPTCPSKEYSECSAQLAKLKEVPRDRFMLKSNDDEQTSSELAIFLKANAFDASLVNKESIRIKYQDAIFLISPKANKGGLSRIVVEKQYIIEPQYRETVEILKYVIKLNQSFNVATFSVRDSSTLVMQSSITFVDRIDAEEIKKFFEYINTSVLAIILKMPETILFLK